MATEREIQLVEAALKAAAQECERMARVLDLHGAQRCAGTIRSLDPAAIVASVPQPAEQPEDGQERFEVWAKREGFNVARRDDEHSPDMFHAYETEQRWQVWQAAKRDALTQAPQRVELTDAEIREIWIDSVSTDPELHDWPEMLDFARTLLSASKGKK